MKTENLFLYLILLLALIVVGREVVSELQSVASAPTEQVRQMRVTL